MIDSASRKALRCKAPVLSVVIPTFNESARIASCLQSLTRLQQRGARIIVCDGNSSDDTVEIAHRHGAQVVHCARGRARQMNAGADASSARMLAFLHADTRLNDAVLERLWALACDSSRVWGRFDVRLSGSGIAFRVIETCMNLRSRITGIATGDQLIFCSSELFHTVNAFAEIDLMEDIHLSAKLRRVQRPVCCAERVRTSSRKWRENGVMRTVLLMWRLRAAYALGADPARLAKMYSRNSGRTAAGPGAR
jgi:rSAM/selenodomain-associated transferase 2